MTSSADAFAWIPFAFAGLLVLVQPFLNAAWLVGYEAYYQKNYTNPTPSHGQLRAGAEWAVDVAFALPNTALTLVGVVLLGHSPAAVAASAIVVLVLVVGVAMMVVRRHDLTERRHAFAGIFSPLATVQLVIAAVGLVLALTM